MNELKTINTDSRLYLQTSKKEERCAWLGVTQTPQHETPLRVCYRLGSLHTDHILPSFTQHFLPCYVAGAASQKILWKLNNFGLGGIVNHIVFYGFQN